MTASLLAARAAVAQLRRIAESADDHSVHMGLYARRIDTANADLIRLWLIYTAIVEAADAEEVPQGNRDIHRLGPIIGRTWADVARGLTWFCLGPIVRVVLGCELDRPETRWDHYLAARFLELFDGEGKPTAVALEAVKRIDPSDWKHLFATLETVKASGDADFVVENLTAEFQALATTETAPAHSPAVGDQGPTQHPNNDTQTPPRDPRLPIVDRSNPHAPTVEYKTITYSVKPDAADLFDLLIDCKLKGENIVPVNQYLPDLRIYRVKDGLPKPLQELIKSGRGLAGTELVLPE